MNEIHPSAIIPVAVTWLVIIFMFSLAFYFAFFAPVPETESDLGDGAEESTAGKGRP